VGYPNHRLDLALPSIASDPDEHDHGGRVRGDLLRPGLVRWGFVLDIDPAGGPSSNVSIGSRAAGEAPASMSPRCSFQSSQSQPAPASMQLSATSTGSPLSGPGTSVGPSGSRTTTSPPSRLPALVTTYPATPRAPSCERKGAGSVLLSYLLFDGAFIDAAIGLGRRDAQLLLANGDGTSWLTAAPKHVAPDRISVRAAKQAHGAALRHSS